MLTSENRSWQKYIEQVYTANQGHILVHWDALPHNRKKKLIEQIASVDFALLQELCKQALGKNQAVVVQGKLEPAECITLTERKTRDSKALKAGEQCLRDGRVAAFLVAGGQGTRLGFDGPKGMFPATPVKKKTLFQLHAEKILATSRKYEVSIPWVIMTSQSNNDAAINFFRDNNFFGLPADNIRFIVQDMIPAIDRKGKLIIDDKDHIFMNPNGHGGSLKALWETGTITDLKEQGIDTLFYFQVDNVLTRICDPVYLGYHVLARSDMSNKVVRKKYAGEKMGVLCKIKGKLGLVEYSDFDEDLKNATNPDGSLRFWAGNIATHIFDLDFIERENRDGFRLPYHVAEKSIPYLSAKGDLVRPTSKNGIKFESFVFDALQHAEKAVSIEVLREEEFSPLKNSEGENSPQTIRQHQNNFYGSWLAAAGINIERDPDGNVLRGVEVAPLVALDEQEFLTRYKSGRLSADGIYLE